MGKARCVRFLQGERHAEEESPDEDEWSDQEDTDTPIDDVDPFVIFADAIRQLQLSSATRFRVRPAVSRSATFGIKYRQQLLPCLLTCSIACLDKAGHCTGQCSQLCKSTCDA